MLGIVIKLLDQRSYSHIITDDVGDSHYAVRPEKLQSHVLVRSSQTMLEIVIKLLDQRNYSHMF